MLLFADAILVVNDSNSSTFVALYHCSRTGGVTDALVLEMNNKMKISSQVVPLTTAVAAPDTAVRISVS